MGETAFTDKNGERIGLRAKKTSLDLLIHFFCFLSVLLIGADIWGVNVGVNLRLDQLFLVVLTLLLGFKNAYYLTENKHIILFAFFCIISAALAFNPLRGVIFYFSVIYNIVFIFYCFQSYVKFYGVKKFISVYRKTMYVQFFILAAQVVLSLAFHFEFSFLPSYGRYMGIPRFSLWFYEPSYFATYVVFWFALSAYMLIIRGNGGYITDCVMGAVMLVISTSTTGFLGVALVVVSVYITWIIKGITLKKVLFLLFIIAAIVAFRFIFSSLFDTFIARLFNGDINAASGGRVEKWKETIEVFLKKPLFGVGPGNYGLYLNGDVNNLPSNVTLELLATTGIFATLAFYGLTFSLFITAVKLHKKYRRKDTSFLVGCVYALLIFTVILQANQGYLRLYHWMFFGFIAGAIKAVKTKYLVK